MDKKNNFITVVRQKVSRAKNWAARKLQQAKFVMAAGLIGSGLVMGVTSCEKKSVEVANYEQSTSAGTLATLTCADTASIPVDANGIITATTLTKNKLWKLNGVSFVKDGQTLTIEAGTTIIAGRTKTYTDPIYRPQDLAGVLVVAKGGKLIANGTATAPIVFTSPSAGGCGTGCSNAGAFGGIILLGKAPTNRASELAVEGIPRAVGHDITYGGSGNNIASDNSGSLKYVRIEFPGYRLAEDNGINGLTLAGVGNGTTLSHIQVSYSGADAFKFLGGTVNADHLVAIGIYDDDFDFDFGYTGTINYAIGLKDPGITNSTSGGNSDSNGIESDNDGGGTGATPRTKPVLRHFTLLGYNTSSPKLRNGSRWRRGSGVNIQKSIIGGFPNSAVLFESPATIAAASGFTNNVVHGFTSASIFLGATPAGNVTVSGGPTNFYLQLGDGDESSFLSCGTLFNPNKLKPNEDSEAYGDGTTTYWGAFAPNATTLWTNGWTNFAPGFCCN